MGFLSRHRLEFRCLVQHFRGKGLKEGRFKMDTQVTPRGSVSEPLQSLFFICCSTEMPFTTAQTHCWAVLNFREWHLSSKSWSTCLLPKITTVQGYFSYNSSGFWLCLLLRNCLHITLGALLLPTPCQPPKSSSQGCLGWKLCIYLAEEANIWSLSPSLLPFFICAEILVGPGLFLQSHRFLKIFHDGFTLEKWEFTLILVSAKWRDF